MKKRFNIRNSLIFHDYYSRLKLIALSLFEWSGLPKSCSARFLEESLFHYGQAIFIEDEDMSYLTLKAVESGELNVYNEPLYYTAFSTGYSKMYNADECVFIRNNYINKSTESTLILYAERLAKIQLAIDINVNAQKTPILIRTEEKTQKSLQTIYNYYEGDAPVIIASKSLQDKPLEVLKTDAPYVVDKLREEKRNVWNEALEFLGLNTNPSENKKERLIVNEVNSNNEQVESQENIFYITRLEACEKINEKYGLNVSVNFRIDKLKNAYMEGGAEFGEIYNGIT